MYADWSLKMESNRGALLKSAAMRRDVLLKFERLSFRHYQRPMSHQQKEKKIKEARIFFKTPCFRTFRNLLVSLRRLI